jgi:hypothetical protein
MLPLNEIVPSVEFPTVKLALVAFRSNVCFMGYGFSKVHEFCTKKHKNAVKNMNFIFISILMLQLQRTNYFCINGDNVALNMSEKYLN